VVALDYLYGMYQQINTYPHLVGERIALNADVLDEKELHQAAWALVDPIFNQHRSQALEKYHHLQNSTLVSNTPADILTAAYYGRVEALFVSLAAPPLYGRFTPETALLEVQKISRPYNANLFDLAAV